MSTIKNQPLRVLNDLTTNLKAQIDAQRPHDEDYSREITIRLSAIDAILAHCSLCVFNNDPEVEEEDEDDVDLATLAQQVFGGAATPDEVRAAAELPPVGGVEGETLMGAADESAALPDGIYRLEFDYRTDREHVAISDFEATVLEGYQAGGKVTERLSFGAVFTNADRAARTKARRFAQIFGLNENESDSGAFLYRPFIAHVVDGEIAEAGVDSLSELPTGQSRIARGHAIRETPGRPWGAPAAA